MQKEYKATFDKETAKLKGDKRTINLEKLRAKAKEDATRSSRTKRERLSTAFAKGSARIKSESEKYKASQRPKKKKSAGFGFNIDNLLGTGKKKKKMTFF